jgi:uncharacterized protein (DUF934 family)
MLLDKSGNAVAEEWRHLADNENAPEGEAVTVSLARWERDHNALKSRDAKLGLRLPNTANPVSLNGEVHRFALIALEFPNFKDGRAYSQARLLRSRLGYKGELRATGNVLRDQLLFMRRAGFDSFEVDGARAKAENWAQAFGEFDVFYQPAEDHRPWAMRQRFLSAK